MPYRLAALLSAALAGLSLVAFAEQSTVKTSGLDEKVRAFLDSRRHSWRDMNVPAYDGQQLHDVVVKNGYTRALEIGTSTGHSGIWIA